MNMPEDLHREHSRSEKYCEYSERAMQRMDSKDYDRGDASNAIFTCSSARWDALLSALALHDSLEAGRQIDNIFYEYLVEKEIERE